MNFIEFVKSPWGTVCLGVLSSIVGALLYALFASLYAYINKRIQKRRIIKGLVKVGESFGDGYTAAYAQYKSTFHQSLLVGNYEIQILLSIAKTIAIALAGIVLLIVFQEIIIARPIIVAITCVLFFVSYGKVKSKIKSFKMMYDHVFGDEYKEKMMEGIKQHWDTLAKNKGQNKKGNTEGAEQ